MDNESEQLVIEFNSKAIKIFFSLFDRFMNSVGGLNRQKDENVFQQQLSKYQSALKEQLEVIARGLIEKKHPLTNSSLLNKTLTGKIAYYLHEFKLKSMSV